MLQFLELEVKFLKPLNAAQVAWDLGRAPLMKESEVKKFVTVALKVSVPARKSFVWKSD